MAETAAAALPAAVDPAAAAPGGSQIAVPSAVTIGGSVPGGAAPPPLPLPVISAVPVHFRRPQQRVSTRYVQLSNCGPGVGVAPSEVAALLAPFGPGVVVHAPPDASAGYLHASFPTIEQAARAIAAMDGAAASCSGRAIHARYSEPREAPTGQGAEGSSLVDDVVDASFSSASSRGAPVAWLRASEVGVPGLSLLESFVSEAEEAALLQAIDSPALSDCWELLARRRVLHFGRAFSYVSRGVDDARRTPAIASDEAVQAAVRRVAEAVRAIGEGGKHEEEEREVDRFGKQVSEKDAHGARLGAAVASENGPTTSRGCSGSSSLESSYPFGWVPDQVTVNEYPLGVGISPHVDTHSAFRGPICSLSLASDASMTFRRAGHPDVALRLPRRSLVVMAGESRLAWQHYVPHRRADAVVGMGKVPRAPRRVSCTFRAVREPECEGERPVCRCEFPEDCDSRGGGAPPTRRALELLKKTEKRKEKKEGDIGGESGDAEAGGERPSDERICGGAVRRGVREASAASDSATCPWIDARNASREDHENARGKAAPLAPEDAVGEQAASSAPQGAIESTSTGTDSSRGESSAPSRPLPSLPSSSPSSCPSSSLSVSELSSNHVIGVYDIIAPHFSSTRFSVWPAVRAFVEALPRHAVVTDLGCGNGKYLGLRNDCYWIGSDRSTGLLRVAADRLAAMQAEKKPSKPRSIQQGTDRPSASSAPSTFSSALSSAPSSSPSTVSSAPSSSPSATPSVPSPSLRPFPWNSDVYVADALVPCLRASSLDAAISIAVLHHLPTPTLRLGLLRSMRDALRPGGQGLVTVWATEQVNQAKVERWKRVGVQEKPGTQTPDETEAPRGRDGDAAATSRELRFRGRDVMVPWHVPLHRPESLRARGSALAAMHVRKGTVELERYYHLFEEGELAELVEHVPGLELAQPVFYDRDNWCAHVRRID